MNDYIGCLPIWTLFEWTRIRFWAARMSQHHSFSSHWWISFRSLHHQTTLTQLLKGGSTEEAQSSIGIEVGTALVKYINTGSTLGSVNFPEADLRMPPEEEKCVRIINCHHNVPGVLKVIPFLCSLQSTLNLIHSKSTALCLISTLLSNSVIQEEQWPTWWPTFRLIWAVMVCKRFITTFLVCQRILWLAFCIEFW